MKFQNVKNGSFVIDGHGVESSSNLLQVPPSFSYLAGESKV